MRKTKKGKEVETQSSLLTDGFVCHIQHGANDVIFLPHFAERLGTHVPLAALQQLASPTRVINCDNLFDKSTATTKRCNLNRLTARAGADHPRPGGDGEKGTITL